MIGAQLSGWLFGRLLDTDPSQMHAWRPFWILPALMALVILIGFWMYFEEGPGRRTTES